jgi:hypothetical protein
LLVIDGLPISRQDSVKLTSYPVWLSRIPLNLSAVTLPRAR